MSDNKLVIYKLVLEDVWRFQIAIAESTLFVVEYSNKT